MADKGEQVPSYSRFACIGSGFSAVALGATLQRWYGITDVRFFERHDDLGGTWFVNRYPGEQPPPTRPIRGRMLSAQAAHATSQASSTASPLRPIPSGRGFWRRRRSCSSTSPASPTTMTSLPR